MIFLSVFQLCLVTAMKDPSRKRVKIQGHYMRVRQRSTKKGKKGTILSKWASSKGKKRVYRCAVATNSTDRKNCGHKKAGKYCLYENTGKKKCSRLIISYN
jgi:hypothetical protein